MGLGLLFEEDLGDALGRDEELEACYSDGNVVNDFESVGGGKGKIEPKLADGQ